MGSHHRRSFFEASGGLVLIINTLGFHQMERVRGASSMDKSIVSMMVVRSELDKEGSEAKRRLQERMENHGLDALIKEKRGCGEMTEEMSHKGRALAASALAL